MKLSPHLLAGKLEMEKTELVFIPFSAAGHLTFALEIAKTMALRDPRLSITIIIMRFPFLPHPTPTSDSNSNSIRFVALPPVEFPGGDPAPGLMFELMKTQIPLVRDAVREVSRSGSALLGGFVLDMFCTQMTDVADEFGVPSYLLYTSGAAFLGFHLHLQFLHDTQGLDLDQFKDSDTELEIPSYANPVPGKFFPSLLFDKEGGSTEIFMRLPRNFRQFKGILVNTFFELESTAVRSFSDPTLPTVYPVGPLLNTEAAESDGGGDAMRWLDDQPRSSVIFLCFGSRGSFGEDQVKEIAHALERSGHRFLWSARQPPPTKRGAPTDYENVEDVLPEGFLDRTATIGKVIGWAPQTAVLAHPAVGGFVSHCGWNSTLESIWYGVPVATWPLFGDQQLNAFQMVKDLGLAVEIKMDYHHDSGYIVSSEEIEIGLKKLMSRECEARKKREEMKNISRLVMMEGGSSYLSLGRFIEDMMMATQFSH